MAKPGFSADDEAALKEARIARRWGSEIELAGKREREFIEKGDEIVSVYRGAKKKRNAMNILWSNTEILRPAIYAKTPKPDVRRRFRDADPIGKAVAEILERTLYVVLDQHGSHEALKNDALDSLLPGRGVSRLRYEPKISSEPRAAADADEKDEDEEPEVDEKLEDERVCIDHVDWKDFRHGYGRTWEEVPWVAFRNQLSDDEAEEKFGEDAIEGITFTPPVISDKDQPKEGESNATDMEKVAEFWEVWDKRTRKVFFVNLSSKMPRRLYPQDNPSGEPPLSLTGFFPCPRPCMVIENTGSLEPIPIFRLYEQQAIELDRISMRINKLVDAMKLRGAYDSSLPEMADIMQSNDNDLTPVSKAAAWRDNGGLDKALTWVPIGPAAQVLEQLYKAREACKQTIYEITGISDIVRGASLASETATAQQIKANYASVRLNRMQAEVQRYCRDVLAIAGEIIAEKFGTDTLAKMTGLQFPTEQQKVQAKVQMMQAMQNQPPPQPGAPPPPPPPENPMLQMPSWEDIQKVMRSDAMRLYKIDIETDSTVASSIEGDMDALSKLMQAVGTTMQTMAPAIQSQALPVDAAKEIMLAVVRRAKLGIAVEDALEHMQAPKPPPPPPDHSVEVAQIKAQSDQSLAQLRGQIDTQSAQAEAQMEAARVAAEKKFDAQVKVLEAQHAASLDQLQKQHEQQLESVRIEAENLRAATQLETQRMIADADNATKIRVAEIQAQHQADMQARDQAHQAELANAKQQHDERMAKITASMKAESTDETPTAAEFKDEESDDASHLMPMMQAVATSLASPKRIRRDDNGAIVGVEHDPVSVPQGNGKAKMSDLIPLMTQIAFHISKPKRVVRDENGKITGVE